MALPQNDDTSVFALDTASPYPEEEQQVLSPGKRTQKGRSKGRKHQTNRSRQDVKKTISELKAANRTEIQSIKSKYQTENKLLRDELKERAKKGKEELRTSMAQAERNYQKQLDQLRADSNSQTMALRAEMKKLLDGHLKEITDKYNVKLANENSAQLEKLEKWIRGEFIETIQVKTGELEGTKAAADAQESKLVQEIDGKNQHILFLEEKIKEISHYLPEDEEQELYEELGLEIPVDDDEDDEPRKGKHKGLFSRLTSVL
ncbi:MAG: hypothetical protein MN733_11575 [Nitrososphaera sp.]|nr:hypothetical protein [Nitrososphaera sp.]